MLIIYPIRRFCAKEVLPDIDDPGPGPYDPPMLIGLLSDTHGADRQTARAAEILADRKVQAVFHAGDIGSESVLIELSTVFLPRSIPVYAVTGNVDLYSEHLEHFPASAGVEVTGRWCERELKGHRIGVLHGDDYRLMQQIVKQGDVDYLITGHTHVAEDRREGSIRIINPGAVYRTPSPSVAVLDLAADTVEWIGLED